MSEQKSEIEKVREWLNHIGETDQPTRREVRDNCLADPECMAYFVMRFEMRGDHDIGNFSGRAA